MEAKQPSAFRARIAGSLALLIAAAQVALAAEEGDWSDPARFEEAIVAFETQDAVSPPDQGVIVFVGSSSIRMWKTLADDMRALEVLNRGFGGSQLVHVIHNARRIVTPYRPKAVVVYAGDNDLAAGSEKTAEIVLADFRALARLLLTDLPDVQIYFLSIKPSKARWQQWPEMKRANQLIEGFIAAQPNLHYVDVASVLLQPDGSPRDDVFIADGLHLNATGYAEWTAIVQPLLARDLGARAAD